jgi:fido (protein-threonine AMPylation protein)
VQSFVDLDRTFGSQPRALGALLARIDTGRGQERLFEDQRPELLKQLAEHARIASIKASNAIEGVVVGTDRAERIAEGAHRYRNRNEREFAGYRDAIDMLMRLEAYEELSVPLVLHLHRLLFEYTDGNGGHLKMDQNLIVSYESGSKEVVFTPTRPEETEFMLSELLVRYEEAKAEGRTHPLILIGALVLDFLAIHPVADGNGRLARLLTTYELLAQGYRVARYVSLEQRIYESKNTYYKALMTLSATGTSASTTSGRGLPTWHAFSPPPMTTSSKESPPRASSLAASRTGFASTSCTRHRPSSVAVTSSERFPGSVSRPFGSSSPSFATPGRSSPKAREQVRAGTGSDSECSEAVCLQSTPPLFDRPSRSSRSKVCR